MVQGEVVVVVEELVILQGQLEQVVVSEVKVVGVVVEGVVM